MKYWKDIKPNQRVVDKKSHFEVNGETIFWNGNEATRALEFLTKRSKKKRK